VSRAACVESAPWWCVESAPSDGDWNVSTLEGGVRGGGSLAIYVCASGGCVCSWPCPRPTAVGAAIRIRIRRVGVRRGGGPRPPVGVDVASLKVKPRPASAFTASARSRLSRRRRAARPRPAEVAGGNPVGDAIETPCLPEKPNAIRDGGHNRKRASLRCPNAICANMCFRRMAIAY
jgi:hypothetical protein